MKYTDDDEMNRIIVRQKLTERGYPTVLPYPSGPTIHYTDLGAHALIKFRVEAYVWANVKTHFKPHKPSGKVFPAGYHWHGEESPRVDRITAIYYGE